MKLKTLLASTAALLASTGAWATTYTWTGASGDGKWSTAGNWTVLDDSEAEVVATEYPNSVDDVDVVFPALAEDAEAWSVTMDVEGNAKTVVVNGDTVFTAAESATSSKLIRTTSVTGDGKITLGDYAGFRSLDSNNTPITIENNLEITASDAKYARIQGYYTTKSGKPDQGGCNLNVSGNLTGTGKLAFITCRAATNLSGNNSEFAGSILVWNDQAPRHALSIKSTNASSAKAKWEIYNSGAANCTPSATGTTNFGELTGYFRREVASNWAGVGYLNVGALGTDFTTDGVFGTGSDRADKIIKKGTGTMTFVGKRTAGIDIEDGAVAIASQNSLTNGWTAAVCFKGGTLQISGDVDPTIKNSTKAIQIENAEDMTIATAIDSTNKGGFTKKGEGTLTLTGEVAYTGTTAVEAGALIVPAGTALTLGAQTKSEELEDGTIKLTFDDSVVAAIGNTGYKTIAAALAAATDGDRIASFVESLTVDSEVSLTDKGTISVDGAMNVTGTLTLANTVLRCNTIVGEGKIVLADAGELANYGAEANYSCEIEVTASEDTPAIISARTSNLAINVTGKLTGSGKVNCVNASQVNSTGVKFSCDSSEFAGTIQVVNNDINRNFTAFDYVCDFSKAKVIADFARTSGKMFTNYGQDRTYKFGSLSGYVYQEASNLSNNKHAYIEIGALNLDDSLTGTLVSHSTRSPYLRKIGTGTLTSAVKGVHQYILNGGTLVLTTDATTIDTEAPVTTELEGYTVVATPNYDEDDGTTLVSTTYTLAAPTGPSVDGDGTIEAAGELGGAADYVVTPAENQTVVTVSNLPEGKTVAVPTSVDTVKGVAAEQIVVAYNGTAITGAFTLTGDATEGVTIALDKNGSVTINGETIAVDPEFTEGEEAATEVAEGVVEVKSIPGLKYGLVGGATLTGDAAFATTVVEPALATSTKVTLTDASRSTRGDAFFYRVKVTK